MNKLLKSVVSLVIAVAMVMSVVSAFAVTAGAAEDKGAIMPTYEGTIKAVEAANDYYQSRNKYNQEEYGDPICFWEKSAYETGNMEVYYTTGIEAYRQYATNWANACGWKGHPSTNKGAWTWSYHQELDRHAVLFGDFQICFQTFIDLYNIEKSESKDTYADPNKIARAIEVMSDQVSRSNDDFWWWADGLYMVMPVMTKLYKTTGDEKYLDGLYRFWRYGKELMYDGPGGIPTSVNGYTTSARLLDGANYSDPNNYAYLFYRDAKYVFPRNEAKNPGHENEKNFWARGNGWVFAGLAKVLQDIPDDWEHYDEFLKTYLEMAPAIKNSMRVDENGYGFWTQSMLQNFPRTNANPMGYETSGTAFFTYGFAWGINAGILPKDEYLETAVRAWNYLENVALQPSGLVGYIQNIGERAVNAAGPSNNQNFGLGAFLLAGCEMSRLVGGSQGDMYPNLQRKMQTYLALRVNTPHYYRDGKIGHIDENDHSVEVFLTNDLNGNSTSMMPARLVVESFGGTVEWNEAARTVTAKLGDRNVVFTVDTNVIKVNGVDTFAPANTVIVGGRTFVPLRALAESLGKKVYWNQGDHPSNGLIVVGHKAAPFYTCDANLVEMLRTMLGKPETYPERPKQPEKSFVPKVPTLADANRIQAEKIEASEEPEGDHGAYNASDGRLDENSRYAGKSNGCNITFTYKDPVDVGQVALTFWKPTQRTTNYKLEYTADGSNWKQVYQGASTLGKANEVFDINTKVKAFKIYGYGNSENEWFSLIEFAVYKPGVKAGDAVATTITDSTSAKTDAVAKATGKKVTISTSNVTFSQEPEANNAGRNAFDGNASTVWAANGPANAVIDLGKSIPVSEVGVQFKLYEDDRTIPFTVSVSDDKNAWTAVFTGSSKARDNAMIFAPVGKNARYVKLNVEGHAVSAWSSVAEIEVYSGDAAAVTTVTDSTSAKTDAVAKATGKKVTISTNNVTFSQEPEANNAGRNAFDGNASTVWAANGPANAVIDLGKSVAVSEVGVQFKLYEDDRTIPFTVSVSDDKNAWTTVFTGSSKVRDNAMIFATVGKNARYVKLNVEGHAVSAWSSVAEVEVYSK